MKENRDFKGIWIPKEIWLIKKLKPVYRVFLAEIDSLDSGNGCWAGNEHFAELFGLSKNRCSEIISMLEKEGYVTIWNEGKNTSSMERKISLSQLVEKSTDLSRNRSHLSRNRSHLSRNRQVYNKDEIYNEKYNERETRAIDFLKSEYPSRFEQQFSMPYSKKIKDLKKFFQDFNDTVDQEELSYSANVLFGRLGKYARNWIQNQDKYSNQEEGYEPTQNLRRLV